MGVSASRVVRNPRPRPGPAAARTGTYRGVARAGGARRQEHDV